MAAAASASPTAPRDESMIAVNNNNNNNNNHNNNNNIHLQEPLDETIVMDATLIDHEKCKLERWLKKLDTPDAVRTFNLDDPGPLRNCAQKFARMIATVQFGIQTEWIEEFAADGSDDIDNLVRSIQASDGTAVSVDSQIRYTHLPPATEGRQKPLDTNFNIIRFPFPGSEYYSKPEWHDKLYECAGCGLMIWNRCWVEMAVLERYEQEAHIVPAVRDEMVVNAPHYCSQCCCRLMPKRGAMIMFERLSIQRLIKLYRAAVVRYNQTFQPLIAKLLQTNPCVSFVELDDSGRMIDEFEKNDPRMPNKRSMHSVAYHLWLRYTHGLSEIYCHQCKVRKPAVETLACSDLTHMESMLRYPAQKHRNGYFYCGRCLHNRYGLDPVECLCEREWDCFVCRKRCNCAACRSGSTVSAKAMIASAGGNSTAASVASNSVTPASSSTSRQSTPNRSSTLASTAPRIVLKMSTEGSGGGSGGDEGVVDESSTVEGLPSAPQPTAATSRNSIGRVKKRRMDASAAVPISSSATTTTTLLAGRSKRHTAGKMSHSSSAYGGGGGSGGGYHYGTSNNSSGGLGGVGDLSVSAEMMDMSLGRLINNLQQQCRQLTERNEYLTKEVDELRDLAAAGTSYHDLMRQSLQLKLDLGSAREEVGRLRDRNRQLEQLNRQAGETVVPNLHKIARAVATQAANLAKYLPDYSEKEVVVEEEGQENSNMVANNSPSGK